MKEIKIRPRPRSSTASMKKEVKQVHLGLNETESPSEAHEIGGEIRTTTVEKKKTFNVVNEEDPLRFSAHACGQDVLSDAEVNPASVRLQC